MKILRSLRVRAVLVLAVAGAAVVFGVMAHFTHPDTGSTVGQQPPAPTAAVTPAPTSPPVTGDDGAPDSGDQAAVITDGPADPKEAATEFLVKYLNTQGKTADQWRAGFAALVTPDLARLLADTDPDRVPAGRVGGPIAVTTAGDELVAVTVPIVANSDPSKVVTAVELTLTGATHRWLVSELDVAGR